MEQKKKFYLTKKGLEKIKTDLKNLRFLKLAKINGETPSFMHSDEISQEYLDFEGDLEILESKLMDLEHIVENAEVVRPPGRAEKGTIKIGAKVLVNVDGIKDELTILGTLEANPNLGIISNESPVGRALLGHKIGDAVSVSSPIVAIYKIKKIQYF